MYDIVIIGAGASGLFAASLLQKQTNLKICLIDKNPKIGAKIKVSGGGKCNITNKYLSSSHYLGDQQFISEIFSQFDQQSLLDFLKSNNIYPNFNEKIVKGTYFCNSSDEIIRLFAKLTSKCDLLLGHELKDVEYKDDFFVIKTDKKQIRSHKMIIASGGLSYPALGATDIGFDIAKKFGHTIITPNPALVGFTVQKDQFWFKELSGLSIDVKVKVEDKILEGSLLFTHKGCSGPVILSTSLYWKKGLISIDFAPTKESYLPKRFKQAIKDLDIDIHNYHFAPAGNFGYTKAEVTKGGVCTNELSFNLKSKIQKDLYFIGEVVNVTGELGGYNFQWAFSSAYCAVQSIISSKRT